MTTAISPRSDVMITRLQNLRAERDEVLGELIVTNSGDTADRATNVDANARLTLIEQRIVAVENQLQDIERAPRAKDADAGVAVGDIVSIDFGDGPETYLLADLEQAGGDLDVITPSGPVGRAIIGATAGDTITYKVNSRRELTAKIVSVN